MDQEEALKQIKLIRQIMYKAAEHIFFSPWQWIEWGLLITIGCALTIWRPFTIQQNHLLFLWIIIFILGGALETLIWMRAAQIRGIEPFNPFILKIWGVAGCIMMIAIIMSLVFFQLCLFLYIPGLWMLSIGAVLYACVILGGRKRLLIYGTILIVSGIVALSFFVTWSLYVLMVGFGFGALFFGFLQLFMDKKNKTRE